MEVDRGLSSRAPRAASVQTVRRGDESDAALIRRVGEGDRNAFDLLYGRYARSVFGLALRRLGDRGLAEDAVQDTFAAIWRSANSYRAERGSAGAWVYTVARNAVVDRARARREPAADAPDSVSPEAGPEERAEAGWTAWVVHRAFEDLRPQERTVLELAYWGDMSQSEIAAFLGVPLGTVKTRTRNGLARLADLLEEEELR
jgi:RNA polymerase sigma-70 factor (ECF subfamily)